MSGRRPRLEEDTGEPRHSLLPTLHPQNRPIERSAFNALASILNGRPAAQVSTVGPREELVRVLGEFNHSIQEARRLATTRTRDEDTTMSTAPGRDLRRRFNRDPPIANETVSSTGGSSSNTPSLPPLRSLGSRRESSMSSSPAGIGGTRSRSLAARWANNYRSINSISSDLADLDRNLENANSHLQALLDYTLENPSQSYMSTLSPPPAQPEHMEDSRRIKRRKLDSDKISSNFKSFRYGKYGQVEPGRLRMEIVSCDGGLYSSGLVSDSTSYAVENILKNDSSVYCTKGNRCNIVLRHQGATVFSLKELVIKAPGFDYSSPVREGMVFVSMNQDDLLKRTEQYQIQYVRPRRSSPPGSNPQIYSIRHEEDGTQPLSSYSARPRRQHGRQDWNTEEDDEENYRTAQIPSEFNVSPPPFNITTECSDDSGAEGAPLGRVRRRRTPNRIGALPFESDSSDEGGPTAWGEPARLESGWEGSLEDLTSHLHRANRTHEITSHYLREHGRGRNNDNGLAEAEEASQAAMQEAVRAVGGSLMTPLAHFYIEKDKNKCTIRFDPPVSGRFILLKMWSPHHDPAANIDIQGVVAKGYAGPRYFPAVELM